MRRMLLHRSLFVAVAAALAAVDAPAVSLGTKGMGQALIYPYYTVRTSAGGNAFNTYLSVVNHNTAAKAVRVRVREGRAAKPVLDFNLFLGPNDVWTGALVPTADGTRLLTTDTSCTDPAFATDTGGSSAVLGNHAYLNDGYGDSLDRTREGYVEMIEMAELFGASAAAVSHNAAGLPVNCAAVHGTAVSTAPPTGRLAGTLTLINVNSGQDFTLDATALDNLATRAFFRPVSNAIPVDFAANEIEPVSVVVAGGELYRSLWTRPQDAVSAVLMRASWTGEYILDNASASLTDFVTTLPTRHFHVGTTTFEPPFTAPGAWGYTCGPGQEPIFHPLGEKLTVSYFNREGVGGDVSGGGFISYPRPQLCAAAAVGSIRNPAIHIPSDRTRTTVLGSTTGGLTIEGYGGSLEIAALQNGWLDFRPGRGGGSGLRSLPGSTRTTVATGQVISGPHSYVGLPIIGFSVRTFSNGTLACTGSGSCQGNYGGAFALKSRRSISLAQ